MQAIAVGRREGCQEDIWVGIVHTGTGTKLGVRDTTCAQF